MVNLNQATSITDEELKNVMDYHPRDAAKIEKGNGVRESLSNALKVIIENVRHHQIVQQQSENFATAEWTAIQRLRTTELFKPIPRPDPGGGRMMMAPDWVFTIVGKAIFACGGYVLLLYVLGITIMKAINSSGQYVTLFKIAQDYFKRKREAEEGRGRAV